MESSGEDRCRHVAFREMLDIRGRQQLRKAVPILRSGLQNALCHQAANHWHRYAQNGRRRAVIDNASFGHGCAWHRAVLPQILRPEQIPSDPAKLVGVSDWNKTAVDDGPDNRGKSGIAAEVILHGMAQCNELARLRVCLRRYRMFFKRALDLHNVFAKEEKTPRWEISLGSYRVADGPGGGDCGKGEVLQSERPLCLGSRHVGRERRVASGNTLVQRFPSDPALRAVPSSAQVEEYSVDFTLTGKIPDPPAGHVCYHLGLV